MESDSWIILISIVLLIGCSAFFSASETSVSTFNRIRMKKSAGEGNKKAALLLKLQDNYNKTISSILIGNNIVNIVASTLGALVATSLLGPAKGAVVAAVSMTLLVLIFGEILPKSYSKDYADKTALALAPWLRVVVAVLGPLTIIFTGLTKLVSGKNDTAQTPSITEEELIYMMDAIEEEGVLEEQERDLVQSALEFDEISLREILTPRVNMVSVDVDEDIDKIKEIIVEEGYSRIPVYEKSIDNIIGVLYTRDFLLSLIEGRGINLREMLGAPLFVHKGMKLSHLLASFKSRKVNLAVVVDEYGGTLGMVTMEDVLEELVGDIWDEDDEIPTGFADLGDGCFELAADYPLTDMLELLELTHNDVSGDFSTVGGWALNLFGRIPENADAFTAFGHVFTVLEMDGHRLKRLGVSKVPDEKENEGDSGTV